MAEEATARGTRVVTRRGDGGETSVGGGARVPKDAARVEACGAIDELGTILGMLRAGATEDAEVAAMLRRVQVDLFHVCADLHGVAGQDAALAVTEAPLLRIEQELAAMDAAMPRLANFILAGGTQAAALAHFARAVARRAERRVVSLAHAEPVNPEILRYLNRLSDFLFVLARRLNDNGNGDDLWAPRGIR
ncbi:Cobalamin adenosyltransferase [Rhodovastum atsumiense]|uniref:Corrinoid adenosyltransferase n=1 Tax=Rhodovastum atsumiense TaxID=504468 RepID=A0A5M6ISI4_9PROT|nr:cob(I)yrinic acid a,c-diamide adenosyltransferase [Rhodovastum atsumiense]KAA5611263.1 cob(I)yrinic acid a,c-diamide adenosyltransferase [Rhodovastum atsumiense]CAH2604000.1 Cobalamin adenosyltransferase [Rhodovastum atsumiense]